MKFLLFLRFWLRNLFSQSRIVSPEADFDVSLTSHSDRVLRVFAAIESLCAGPVKPRRIMLFMAPEDWPYPLPNSLQRLITRGLEVISCPDLGPHKKQQAYLRMYPEFHAPLITVDDDVFYDGHLLAALSSAWRARPNEIHCSRARTIRCDGDHLAPYASWPLCSTSEASLLNFATGVGGVIYPPGFLATLKAAGDSFRSLCPAADDVWMHFNEIRAGYPVRQLSGISSRFPGIPRSSRTALYKKNLFAGHNDVQIRAVYGAAELALLAQAQLASRRNSPT